ncbi:MAG TPA: DNA ligase [Clostridiales bacterium]|nr:DNA ligase [Clostridiales bacterium]
MSRDMFDEKNIVPMAPVSSEPFNSNDYIYEIKFDGMRCIGYYDNGVVLRNRANKDITALFPEFRNIYKQFRHKCIIDSEIVVLNRGKPDYSRLNKRRFLSNIMHIDLMSKRIPATLIVYDILYCKDKTVTEMPLIERKGLLEENTVESDSLAISRFVRGTGTALFEQVVNQELEGIVAKKIDGIYVQGRSRLWLKSKRRQDMDLLLCGYMEGKGFLFCDNDLKYRISIRSVDKNTFDFLYKYIIEHRVDNSPLKSGPSNLKGAIWAKPELYCVVEYMQEMESGYLREAVFKGIKMD